VEILKLQLTEEEVKGALLDEEEYYLNITFNLSLSSMQVTFPYYCGGSITLHCLFIIITLI